MIPQKVREEVYKRDSYDGCPCCVYCGKPLLSGGHLHHVTFRSQLGKDEVDNLVTLCFDCHRRLHDGDKEINNYVKEYLNEKRTIR